MSGALSAVPLPELHERMRQALADISNGQWGAQPVGAFARSVLDECFTLLPHDLPSPGPAPSPAEHATRIREQLERSRSNIARLTEGMDAATAWKYLASIDAALASVDALEAAATEADERAKMNSYAALDSDTRAEAAEARAAALTEALRPLLAAAEAEVGRKEGGGHNAEEWAAMAEGMNVPGVVRRIRMAKAVLAARAVLVEGETGPQADTRWTVSDDRCVCGHQRFEHEQLPAYGHCHCDCTGYTAGPQADTGGVA